MAALAPEHTHRLVEEILQSPPVDVNTPYDPSTLAGSTVLITGGASGIGAALARRWARLGAFVAIGDLDAVAGEALVAELRASAGGDDKQQQQQDRHFFQRCDVTDWQSQVALFRAAARASPTGGIDAVVPAAGIAELATTASGRGFENPSPTLGGDDDDDGGGGAPPPPPSLAVVDVNLTGVLYSVHLALYWLARNNKNNNNNSDGDRDNRDRHILLIGSASGVFPLPGQPLYCAAKHALTGLFRTLRCTAWRHGDGSVRVNMLCPYFIDTPLIPAGGMSLLAGAGLASLPDVVEAATRLAADRAVRGRALVVGPRIKVLDGGEVVEYVDGDGDEADGRGGGYIRQNGGGAGGGQAVWECYAHDYDSVEAFVWRYTRLLNTIERIRGWTGWVRDMVYILFYRNNPQRKGGNDAKKQR